jgi:hypothetical protein
MTLYSPNAITATFENDFAMSLKNGYHQLINSIQVNITNNDVVQVQNYSNLAINYELLTSLSNEDQTNFGSTFGFYGKDTAESITYETPAATSANYVGCGECNNKIAQSSFTPKKGWGYFISENVGRRNRMIYDTSFDPSNTNVTFDSAGDTSTPITSSKFTTFAYSNVGLKNYCLATTSANYVVYYINATIPLKVIHDLFDKMHLTKNMYMRLTVNTHAQCYSTITYTASAGQPFYNTFSTNSNFQTIPFMISQLSNGTTTYRGLNLTGVGTAAASYQLIASVGITKSYNTGTSFAHALSSCRIYIPTYTLSPQEEIRYLDAVPQKTIKYIDRQIYNGSNLQNITPGNPCNAQITNGISRLRAILIIPQIAAQLHGGLLTGSTFTSCTNYDGTTAGSITGTLGTPMNSPFSSSPGTCAPFARISQFNVSLSGVNWYQSNISYGFEQFQNEIRHSNSHDGGEIIGASSGLISKSDWENGYGFIYVNLNRRPDQASDDVSRSVQISFTNSSSITCDYYVVLLYEREITISTSTGALVI